MANRTLSINPDGPFYNKHLFNNLTNGETTADSMVSEYMYRVTASISATGILTFNAPSVPSLASVNVTLEGDTSHTIDLHTTLAGYLFPARVVRRTAWVEVKTAFSVVTTPTITLGDAGDADGLTTAAVGTLDSTGVKWASAAAEVVDRPETAFIPQIVIASGGGNLDTIAAGAMEIVILYTPMPF